MYVVTETLDDMLGAVYRNLLRNGVRVSPTRGSNREIAGAFLRLKNPRARFSRTEQRGTLHSCLGEILWYFSGSDLLAPIEYYIPRYRKFCKLPDDALVAEGAYGPRLFGPPENQVEALIQLINTAEKHDTRQAVLQIFDKSDLGRRDVPCTCTIQVLARGKRLHMIVSMRSNDAYRGLPHDVFAFTMLQEYIACRTNHDVGFYNHSVGSLHLYDTDEASVRQYISAGYPEKLAMPAMPRTSTQASMDWLLLAERSIRQGTGLPDINGIDNYWIDLARILVVKKLFDEKDVKGIAEQKRLMYSHVYASFIRGRELQATEAAEYQLTFPALADWGVRRSNEKN